MSRAVLCELHDFPTLPGGITGWGKEAKRLGLTLRPARRDDVGFLRMLFEDGRAHEMAMVDWPPILKQSFLDSQFALQHRSFLSAFPGGDFLVAEAGGLPVGRVYADLGPPRALLIDIAVLTIARGRGYGRALVREVKRASRARGCIELSLHVDLANTAARRLYLSEGFRDVAAANGFGDEGAAMGRSSMVWCTGSARQLKTA